ncbi:PaaI family thioesterase [Rhodococcus kronopolitis]|uniref:PaaI family thioesterase n=1 Tax=Rhodococcus kronopolitis TaxID=1460226 RepID=A0ABV9FVE6_9NOCA
MDLHEMLATMPFAVKSGIKLLSANTAEVVGNLAWSEDVTTTGQIMHGGALTTLADTVGAVSAYLNIPSGASRVTTASNAVFARQVRRGAVTATARPLHVGRKTVLVSIDITDDEGRLVSQVTQSHAVLGELGP